MGQPKLGPSKFTGRSANACHDFTLPQQPGAPTKAEKRWRHSPWQLVVGGLFMTVGGMLAGIEIAEMIIALWMPEALRWRVEPTAHPAGAEASGRRPCLSRPCPKSGLPGSRSGWPRSSA
jgi:hypothetical protein